MVHFMVGRVHHAINRARRLAKQHEQQQVPPPAEQLHPQQPQPPPEQQQLAPPASSCWTDVWELLSHMTVGTLLASQPKPRGAGGVVTLRPDDSLEHALAVLAEQNVLGAPVVDAERAAPLGFCDSMDMCARTHCRVHASICTVRALHGPAHLYRISHGLRLRAVLRLAHVLRVLPKKKAEEEVCCVDTRVPVPSRAERMCGAG